MKKQKVHQPITAERRTMRIVMRRQVKKSMKQRIKNLKEGMRVAYQAGKESVLLAAHHLEYGPGYPVPEVKVLPTYSPVPDTMEVYVA